MTLSEQTRREAIDRLRARDRRLTVAIAGLAARGRPAHVLRAEQTKVRAALTRFLTPNS